MKVLGIDPGVAITGYGVAEHGAGGSLRWRAHGVIRTPAGDLLERRLERIYDGLCALMEEHRPDEAAVEELFFGKNVTTCIAVAQARGVALLAAAQRGLPVAHYKPSQVKIGVAGVGRAAKDQVRYMTKTLLGLPDLPKPDDAADGLALAICRLLAPSSLAFSQP